MAAQYHSIFTEQGLSLLREAIQNGTKLGITQMSFGDGNGFVPEPDATFMHLVNEIYRTDLNRLAPSANNPNWLEADAVIPSAVGGFNIREVGLWAGEILVAYSNYPPTYKPTADQGTAQIKTIRIVLQIDNTANFELKIDASVVMATIQSVQDAKLDVLNYVDETKLSSFTDINKLKDTLTDKEFILYKNNMYRWSVDSTDLPDDLFIIKSNLHENGRWILVNKNNYRLEIAENNLQTLLRQSSKIHIDKVYELTNTLELATLNNSMLTGIGYASGFKWIGENGAGSTKNTWLPILKAYGQSWQTNSAISGVKFRDFKIDVDNKSNVCAIDCRYITNQSKLDSIKVASLGVNSVGFYLSKSWYNRTSDCSVRGVLANGKNGTGVFVDTVSDASTGSVNQVNAVPLDISVHTCDIGYLIDQSRYIYSLNIPASVTIEHCNVGIKVQGKDAAYIVRNAIISAYFESNGTDVIWGESDSTRDVDSNILWLAASFNDNGSKVVLNEGRHTFIGCTGLETLEINNYAEVELINTIVDNITGNSNSIRKLARRKSRPSVTVTASSDGMEFLKPVSAKRLTQASSGSVTFDLAKDLFNIDSYWGRKAEIKILSRRQFDTNNSAWYEGIILKNSVGEFYVQRKDGSAAETYTVNGSTVTKNKNYDLTVSITTGGILTVNSSQTETKNYEVLLNIY
ncbi:phage tail-collar fiber family protein [Acinetobacter baumannii 21072]|uniref:Phage tail-collar fiber family protein n=1 Tax=Acinetobacter baumannii 21072 TaxID=1310697 RepID=A0A062IVY3_ACIBA|nr:phage tail protein [Acinetobacter baumannii]KCY22682.1 phage tail-collar fiber family protein [Acinetobacter baumannii 21072]